MSTLKTNNVQVGQSGTATNNFTLYQPSTPDGTVRLGVGNSGATTADVVTATSAGNVGIGTSSPNKSGSNLAVTVNAALGQYPALELSTNNVGRWYINADATNVYDTAMNNTNRTFYTGGSERMRIDSSGNVGIGTSSPTAKLGITAAGDATFNSQVVIAPISGANPAKITFNPTVSSGIAGLSDGSVAFYGNGANTERMRITSAGDVGIGTSSTLGARLFVAQGSAQSPATSGNMTTGMVAGSSTAGEALNIGTDADGAWYNAAYANNAGVARIHRWLTGGAERARISATGGFSVGTTADPGAGAIYATGNITAYYSDDRLKTRLGKIENALDKLCSLEGFYYEANETAQALGYEAKREVGVSAQQVQAVMPEIVAPAPIDPKYMTVRYERALPLVIEAIKELRAEVNAIKAALAG